MTLISPLVRLSQIQWVSANWSGGVPASSPLFPCSASDRTPVLTVDTSHTVTEALSTTIAHSTCFTMGHPSATPSIKFCEHRCTLNSLLDLRVFKNGMWGGREPLSPPAGVRFLLHSLANRNRRTLCHIQKANWDHWEKARREHPFSPSP